MLLKHVLILILKKNYLNIFFDFFYSNATHYKNETREIIANKLVNMK